MQLIESLTMVLKRFRENLRPYHLKDENVEKLSILIVLSESKIMVPRYLANEIREGKLDEGTEMKKNNSKYEGSRHEMKPAYDVETLTNVKHDPSAREVFQDLTMLVVCLMQIILTMFNTLLNVKKPSCASSRFPSLEMSPQLMPMPIIQEKLLTVSDSIKMDLVEDVVVDQTASADTIMVT